MDSFTRCEIWQPAGARCAIGDDVGQFALAGSAIANDTEPMVDRGLISRAIGVWDGARSGDGMPSPADMRRHGMADLWPYHGLFDTSRGCREVVVESADRWLAAFCGADPVGRWLSDCLPDGVWDEWQYVLNAVVESRKPLPYSKKSVLDRGRLVHYGVVFLPVSSDGYSPDRILAFLLYRPAA